MIEKKKKLMNEVFFRKIKKSDIKEVSILLNQLKKIDLSKINYKNSWDKFNSNSSSNSYVGVYENKIVAYGSIVIENKIR